MSGITVTKQMQLRMQSTSVANTGMSSHPGGGRIKYANPQDLPSFPSIGLKRDNTAASTAASLGWANQKSFSHWKPDASSSASAAAMLAKDHKSAAAWEPDRNSAGSKAALLAVGAAGKKDTKQPAAPPSSSSSSWGNSAANQAFKARSSQLTPELTPLDRQRSLRAAKGAMTAASSRPRSKSSPQPPKPGYPDQANAAANALSAATIAHKPSIRTAHDGGGAVPFTTMDRQMFTSHPPVKPEVEDQKRADVIHASAVAMAKRMYNQQQRVIHATKNTHQGANSRRPASSDSGTQPAQFTNLQEAAYKLAQDRLAKLEEEHQKTREFQEYYGSSGTPQKRLTIRAKLRRRSSSDGAVIEDRRRSQQIRQQMSLFSNKLSEADEKKRARDREAVLAAAQRNVKSQLQDMDRKVYAETGKVTPAILTEWELKAHAAAKARSEARKDDHVGKIDVGGGMFVDAKKVDEIAAKRVQPLLDEINDKAEKERERQAASKMEEEARRREIEKQRVRDKEIKEIHDKIKEEQRGKDKQRKEELKHEEKLRKEELKHEEKLRKEAEKAERAEEKRQSREERRKEKESETVAVPVEEKAPASPPQQTQTPPPKTKESSKTALFHRPSKLQTKAKQPGTFASLDRAPKSPTSDDSTSPASKMKTWFKSRFGRPRAKSSAETEKSFVGGHALMHADGTGSMTSLGNRSSSMREVALAGKIRPLQPTPRPPVGFLHGDEPGESSTAGRELGHVSSVSSLSSDDYFVDSRERLSKKGSLNPPRAIHDPALATKKSSSPVRDSRFLENL